ncbi:MAG: hypothetical protein J6Y95_00170, partial [Lachnospiraceae bacterium]|nr:hypothetical protein [Lachnospiraceae bacterium]
MSKERMKQMRAPTEEEEALKRKVREEMVQDRCRLLDCQPFVGKLAMHLNMIPVIDCRLTTACTDGTHLYVDAEFYSRLSPAERLGIIAHEVWHCGLRHFQRKGNRDRDKFNYAADVEVDLLLHQDGFKIEMLPFDPEWVGMTAEQIYELMPCGMEHFQKNEKHLYSGDQPEDPCTASGGQGGQSGQDKSDDSSPGNEGGQDKSDNSSPENDGEQDKSDNSSLENDGGQSETSAGSSEEDGEGGGSIGGGNGGGNGGNGRGSGAGLRPGLPNVKHDDVIDPDYCPALSSELGDNWRNNLKTAVQ